MWGLHLACMPTAQAQQDAQYSLYMFNGMALNPAFAGSRELASLTGLFREQWVGFEGAPSTQTLSFHTPFQERRMGAGVWLANDRLGESRTFQLSLAYAYRLLLDEGELSFGVQGGFTQYRADFDGVNTSFNPNIIDPAFNQNINEILPNLGLGVYFQNNRVYAGFSIPQLFNNNLADEITDARQSVHYFATAGYLLNPQSRIQLTPSFMLKYVQGAPLSFDLNALVNFMDKVEAGISYRIGDSIDCILALPLMKNLKLAYAYDIPLNALGEYNNGSHELLLRFEFNWLGDGPNERIITPRHF
ncbi:MAG: type IX secretion system membrane protein PorP/SprF [Microscillaceae bacterium]|nr:type IX secretion system membrane protein PorP/SprF [Microscillaceae bacterium]